MEGFIRQAPSWKNSQTARCYVAETSEKLEELRKTGLPAFNQNSSTNAVTAIPAGLYRHFKGNHYRVLSVARHSETMEPMVVYKALYGDGGVWIRPAEMWNEAVEKDGVYDLLERLHQV